MASRKHKLVGMIMMLAMVLCQDKLCNKLCIKGYHCVNGNCVPIYPEPPIVKKCSCDADCGFNGKCDKGVCTQIKKCSCDADCGFKLKCDRGACVDKCAHAICPLNGYSNDDCCPKIDCSRIACPWGTYCLNGICVHNPKAWYKKHLFTYFLYELL